MVKQVKRWGKVQTVTLGKIPKTDLAWVAGLLEGEGCFRLKNKNLGSVHVMCHMTDKDVLEKLLSILKIGRLQGPYLNGKKKYKPRYVYNLQGRPAYELIKQLLPLMGKRRSIKIKQLIKQYESTTDYVYKLLNINNNEVVKTTSLTDWCTKNKINPAGLYRTYTKERSHYKGWRRLT